MTDGHRILCDCGAVIQEGPAALAVVQVAGCAVCIGNLQPPTAPAPNPALEGKKKAMRRLLTAICEVYGKGECIHQELMERNRIGEFVEPRQVGHYLSIKNLGVSSRECGDFWLRDHSTVSCSVLKIEQLLGYDGVMLQRLRQVRKMYLWLKDNHEQGRIEHRYTADHTAVGVAEFRGEE